MTPLRFPASRTTLAAIHKATLTLEAHWDAGASLELLVRNHELENDGYASSTLSDGSRSTDATSTVERAVVARCEPGADSPTWHLTQAVQAQAQAAVLLGLVAHHVRAYRTPARTPDEKRAHVDTCLACGRVVEGTAQDRLRRGLCVADYKGWIRDGKPDMVVYLRALHVAEEVA